MLRRRYALYGAGVVEVVAVVGLDQVAFLHITQQPLTGLFQGLGRDRVALFAGAQQEVGDISRELAVP